MTKCKLGSVAGLASCSERQAMVLPSLDEQGKLTAHGGGRLLGARQHPGTTAFEATFAGHLNDTAKPACIKT